MLETQISLQKEITKLVRRLRKEKSPAEILLILKKTFPLEKLKRFLIENWHIIYDEKKRTELGAYYTPNEIVDLAKRELERLLGSIEEYTILDPACGCGSFLLKDWKAKKVIGADIDKDVVEILNFLKMLLQKDIHIVHTNSLCSVSREKFGISPDDKLIIVGNPPYNDRTSKNKRSIKQKTTRQECVDKDLIRRDIGMSFFELCVKLKAEVVCYVHPFSYFIKKRNYDQLKNFFSHYRLMSSYVFSSSVFNTKRTPFPMALSVFFRDKRGTSWEFLQRFSYRILGTNFALIPEKIETCDGYIQKYGSKDCTSETGLFFFNFRDLNSLITNGAFSEQTNCRDYIPIKATEFYKYAYLNSLKHHWSPEEELSYVFGNFSPICRKEDLEDEDFQALFMADAIIHNYKRVKQLDFRNENSFVIRFGILQRILKTTRWNLGEKFRLWIEGKESAEKICSLVKSYFEKLKVEFIIHLPLHSEVKSLPERKEEPYQSL